MTPELSHRLAKIMPYIYNALGIEGKYNFIKEVSSAKTFEDLSPKNQTLVLTAESKTKNGQPK